MSHTYKEGKILKKEEYNKEESKPCLIWIDETTKMTNRKWRHLIKMIEKIKSKRGA